MSYWGCTCAELGAQEAARRSAWAGPAPFVRPASLNIQRADAVVIWTPWQVAGVFVCSLGPDNLVTPLSSGAGPPRRTALSHHARHLEVPEPPPPFPPAHRHLETAVDGRHLDVSLKNHLPSIFFFLFRLPPPLLSPAPPTSGCKRQQ